MNKIAILILLLTISFSCRKEKINRDQDFNLKVDVSGFSLNTAMNKIFVFATNQDGNLLFETSGVNKISASFAFKFSEKERIDIHFVNGNRVKTYVDVKPGFELNEGTFCSFYDYNNRKRLGIKITGITSLEEFKWPSGFFLNASRPELDELDSSISINSIQFDNNSFLKIQTEKNTDWKGFLLDLDNFDIIDNDSIYCEIPFSSFELIDNVEIDINLLDFWRKNVSVNLDDENRLVLDENRLFLDNGFSPEFFQSNKVEVDIPKGFDLTKTTNSEIRIMGINNSFYANLDKFPKEIEMYNPFGVLNSTNQFFKFKMDTEFDFAISNYHKLTPFGNNSFKISIDWKIFHDSGTSFNYILPDFPQSIQDNDSKFINPEFEFDGLEVFDYDQPIFFNNPDFYDIISCGNYSSRRFRN